MVKYLTYGLLFCFRILVCVLAGFALGDKEWLLAFIYFVVAVGIAYLEKIWAEKIDKEEKDAKRMV